MIREDAGHQDGYRMVLKSNPSLGPLIAIVVNLAKYSVLALIYQILVVLSDAKLFQLTCSNKFFITKLTSS